jgi:E3 ubiquitin-protein ligase HUWE1
MVSYVVNIYGSFILNPFQDDEIDEWDMHIHPRPGRHRHGHPGPPFQGAIWRIGDQTGWAPGHGGVPRRGGQPRARPTETEGVNPLLRQDDSEIPRAGRMRGEGQAPPWWPTRGGLMDLDGEPIGNGLQLDHPDFGMSFLNNLMTMIQQGNNRFNPGDHIQLTIDGQISAPGRAHLRATFGGAATIFRHHHHAHRHHHHHFVHSHDLHHRNDPAHATRFELMSTTGRWTEEARMMFPSQHQEQATNVINSILRLLVPPARLRQKEEEARLAREKAEAEERARKEKEEQERIAKEKKEREEQEAKERAEREAHEAAEAAQAAAGEAEAESSEQGGEAMEGVESSQPEPAVEPANDAGPSNATAPTERVTYRLGDREIDITSLGIDPAFLDEIPEDMREEVLMGQVVQQRANAASTGDENTDYDQEFLAALPPEMREELIQAELVERRRRERETARQNARANAEARGPSEMDNASFFASLSTSLREQVLAEQDEATLATLPPDLAAEARRLGAGRQRLPTEPHRHGFVNPRVIYQEGSAPPAQSRPRQYVQILDKSGVAALLRLMFMAQSGSAKQNLYDILYHACQNKQNRAEILSTLLSILQDGSSDSGSVERSFAQLSSRAKPSSSGKTPQKRPGTSVSPEMTPLTIMDQCLNALFSLIQNHGKVMEFMLSEHEVSIGFKSRSVRKGKAKETKASRYPINALLGLLDRKSITENSVVMESLTAVLQYMTSALATWDKKRKEIEAKEKEAAEKAKQEQEKPQNEGGEATAEQEQTSTEQASAEQSTEGQPTEPSAAELAPTATEPAEKTKKTKLPPAPPEVSEHNLRLVVSIFAARECTSKTFKSTLYLISNLATIPKAKPIFGEEMMRLAHNLGSNILDELKQLLTQVKNAQSATDVLRVALSKFSPANSDQAKLLRVITCLDYIYNSTDPQLREMFENDTFSQLWTVLSQCLTAIREQGNMMNVATILLPLIEVLMVVCRSSAIKAIDQQSQQPQSQSMEMSISSLREESPMETLFFKFTDEHKKILNDLVRQNPKLMSGSFSLLVKNSKILEFDNKREHFTRKLKAKSPNDPHQAYATLTVNVKRDDIFRDSYRALFFKKPNEVKYGKLNVKFIGEEAVDAGGVTREWFHELVKQIFNPNYVLFSHIASDRTTFHPNESSGVNPEHLSWFKFVGNIIGKAVFENRHLDCHFSQAVYKRILGKPVGVKDMEAHDPAYYKSLVWILENDVSEQEMTFSRELDEFGVTKIVDLIENGQNVKVTNENKREYVSLIVHNLLVAAVEQQLDKLIQGKFI